MFWKNAVVAEVYTLASVQLFAVFLALVRWHDDRRPRDFYLAVGCTGLIASHHTAELLMVPVPVAFVLSVDARWALRPGVLFRSALIGLAALLPYAWVIYRTIDGSSFVEAPARTPWDVVQLITATQFTDRLAAGAVDRAISHSPLFWSAFQEEFGLVALVAAAAGLASLLVSRRWRIAMLLTGSGAVFLCFAAIYERGRYPRLPAAGLRAAVGPLGRGLRTDRAGHSGLARRAGRPAGDGRAGGARGHRAPRLAAVRQLHTQRSQSRHVLRGLLHVVSEQCAGSLRRDRRTPRVHAALRAWAEQPARQGTAVALAGIERAARRAR